VNYRVRCSIIEVFSYTCVFSFIHVVIRIDEYNGGFSATIKIIENLQLKLEQKNRVINSETEQEINC
jgi:hypothetical protein